MATFSKEELMMDPNQETAKVLSHGAKGYTEKVPPMVYQHGLMQSRSLLQGLARALYRNERLSVLKLALIAYDHDIQDLHNQLCKAGAMNVLVRCLQRSLTSVTIYWFEVYQLSQLMGMVFRCSNAVAANSLQACGTDLIVLLFSILLKDSSSRCNGSAVRSLIKRIAELEVSFPGIDQPDRLLLFLEQMALFGSNDKIVSQDSLSILAAFTSHPDSRVFVLQSRTFLDSLIRCSQSNALATEAKTLIARVLRNLTLVGSNRSKMTKQAILKQLVELGSGHQSVSTRLQAIQALKQISVEASGKLFLVAFEGGRVMEILQKSASNQALLPHVVETLLSLTCKCTASPLANYPRMIDLLASIASSEDGQVAEKAAQTIKRLATNISLNNRNHHTLLNAMLLVSSSPCWRVRHWVAKAFLEQSRISGCSFLLVRSAEAVRKISDLARDTNIEVKFEAVETLLTLSASQSNLKRLSMQSTILHTLVDAVHSTVDCVDNGRKLVCRKAILALLNLLTRNRSASKRAAKHPGIVRCLSRYGTSFDEDDELKKAALHGVILLSPVM